MEEIAAHGRVVEDKVEVEVAAMPRAERERNHGEFAKFEGEIVERGVVV